MDELSELIKHGWFLSISWLFGTLPPGPSFFLVLNMPTTPYLWLGFPQPKALSITANECGYKQETGYLYKKQADRHGTKAPRYHVGDRVTEVMLATRDIPLKTRSCKLTSCFIGPFTITKIVNPCAVQLLLPSSKRRIHHTSKHYTILYTIKRI